MQTKPGRLARRYSLKAPCDNCPFRTDVPPYLHRERARDITEALARGSEFFCHKTTVPVEDEDGEETLGEGPNSKHCAGALIMMAKAETFTGPMRLAHRLGGFDPDKLKMDSPVFAHPIQFVDAQEPMCEEHETCGVVGPRCEWPAGHLIGGQAVRGESPSEELPTCNSCGNYVCDSCWGDEDGICIDCEDE